LKNDSFNGLAYRQGCVHFWLVPVNGHGVAHQVLDHGF
jgi:hypothetical protein